MICVEGGIVSYSSSGWITENTTVSSTSSSYTQYVETCIDDLSYKLEEAYEVIEELNDTIADLQQKLAGETDEH